MLRRFTTCFPTTATTASSYSSSLALTAGVATTATTSFTLRFQTQSQAGTTTKRAFQAIPPYKKPPPAPPGVHLPVHHGGGTTDASGSDPYLRKQPNQPTRAPESSVLQSQSGVLISEEERSNPKLLANRRLPLGEWLRRVVVATNNNNSNDSSSSSFSSSCPLEWFISSLSLPYRPVTPVQQRIITRFEEEVISEASIQNSRDPSMERQRWQSSIVRKFTQDLCLFEPESFEEHLSKLKPVVMNFFSSSSSTPSSTPASSSSGSGAQYSAELEEVYSILCDNAKSWRQLHLRELSSVISDSSALQEGGLIWQRFFDALDQHKQELLFPSSNPSSSQKLEQEKESLRAMWISTRDHHSATPLNLSPNISLLFLVVTSLHNNSNNSGNAPLLQSLAKSLKRGGGRLDLVSDTTLWQPRGLVEKFLSREDLFEFCVKHCTDFLSPMDRGVSDALLRFGFPDLAKRIQDATTNTSLSSSTVSLLSPGGGGKTSSSSSTSQDYLSPREKIVTEELIPAFRDLKQTGSMIQKVMYQQSNSPVKSFVIELLEALVAEVHSAAAASGNSGKGGKNQQNQKTPSSPSQQSINVAPLFAQLSSHWPQLYSRFARALLSDPEATYAIHSSMRTAGLSGGNAHQKATAGALESSSTRDAMQRLHNIDVESQQRRNEAMLSVRLEILNASQADRHVVSQCTRMILYSSAAVASQNQNNNNSQNQSKSKNNNAAHNELETLIRNRVYDATRGGGSLNNVDNSGDSSSSSSSSSSSDNNSSSLSTTITNIPDWVYLNVINAVAKEHPTWVPSIISDQDLKLASPDLLQSHKLLLRIFLRLNYVPHAANAVLKSRHRRRIGPIAKNSQQFSFEGEVGFVHEYNNLDYKQWDWQGWYQRMLDVYNRNISMRVRLDDLRGRLDNEGKPFVDLQTERRLRVIAGERVAASVIKLDNDRFEDQKDNLDYGTGKMQQVFSESKKAQLGKEYWPTVEVKVREPSGQTKMRYSVLDWDRVEKTSDKMFEKYCAAKSRGIYVPPTETWLTNVGSGTGAAKSATAKVDEEGYSVDSLFESMDGGAGGEKK